MGTAAGSDQQPFGKRGVVVDLASARHRRRARKTPGLPQVVAISGLIGLVMVLADGQFHRSIGTVETPQQVPATRALASTYIPICSGGDRRARKVTCLVDGDTGWERGIKWRLVSIDTPEISKSECRHEFSTAIAARNRLQDLMSAGYSIGWTGAKGYYGRALVRIRLADGRDAGKVLLEEKLAQPWPNSGNVWCEG